ncbi:helix-turn-helix domain-containing protein [Cellulomonas triticagri]|uniref:XRE family transcriptional regulator n=1 Tax=Cellulomonas triticagri TaxID=2483352 RepID=A0A3M2JFR6_9CELL|nr:XRE family transcriptional regulator [Cellulomonas triticagri]RMI12622.1 XRE family transcriptional regulator [Cellulomonas triticagri]
MPRHPAAPAPTPPPVAGPAAAGHEPGHEPGDLEPVLDAVGPRLRDLRQRRGATLADLSRTTGISVSTLSRLESGQRRPTLELLLPLARAHQVPLDELVGAPETGDPRVHLSPVQRGGTTYLPLTRRPGGLQAYKIVLPAGHHPGPPEPKTHEGYEWMYVLSGQIRLLLGEHDLLLGPGEVVEFDTRVPHWITNPGPGATEVLTLFGPQGERMHVRARPRRRTAADA